MDVEGRVGVFGKDEGGWRRVRVKFGRVVIGFEKRNVENGVKTREI